MNRQVSVRQLELLVEFMTQHKDFAAGRVRTKTGRALSQKLWNKLSVILNAEAKENSYRTPKEWNKFYNDYKCRIKNKMRNWYQSMKKTGGGPGDAPPLSEIEEKLADILGPDKFEPLSIRIDPFTPDPGNNIEVVMLESSEKEPCLSYEMEMQDIVLPPISPQPSTKRDDHTYVLNKQPSTLSEDSIINMLPSTSQEDPVINIQPSTSRKGKTQNKKLNSDDTEVEKTKQFLIEIEKKRIDLDKAKLELKKERNEIERGKIQAINNLTSAAWALADILKPKNDE